MKKNVFWRLFRTAALTTIVWSAASLNVYGYTNNSSSGGTLLDVFRGRGSSSNPSPTVSAPMPTNAGYEPPAVPTPQLTNVNGYGQPQSVEETPRQYPGPQYVQPAPTQQGAVQNKWSLKSWLSGAAPVQPQPQYVEPAPPLTPSYNPPHSHASHPVMPSHPAMSSHPVMPSGKQTQYPVVPLDSEDFRPQEGAIYNEKGEMIYNPESGEPMPNFANAETMQGNVEWNVTGNENIPDASIIPPTAIQPAAIPPATIPPATIPPAANAGSVPNNESEPGAKRVIMGSRMRQSIPVNQERVYNQTPSSSNGSVYPTPEPIPAQMPVNPYAQQPTVSSGNPPVGTGKAFINGNSGATAFSKTYTPGPVRTDVPAEPVMDMAGPELTEALPQSGDREQETGNSSDLPSANSTPNPSPIVPRLEPTPNPAIGASAPAASPVIEELRNDSPLEKLSEKNNEPPVLEPVPESVQEIDIPKEKTGNREQGVGSSENTQSASQEPLATRNSQLATDDRLAASQLATSQAPLIIEIDGPEEVEFGKNEMFSLSVINTTDAVRRDIVLRVHPEGFGDDKTASLNLEQLAPGEKKSVYMKLNARQYNNLSLTAQVRDALGFETTKSISVNVKDESVKISILPPQTGTAYVGQPTQYLIRIVNKASKTVSLNTVAFFGNGIEPIRATGAPNTIQSGQVVVDKPIELKQGEMRDLKIVAVAFQPGVHKILIHLIDSNGAIYAAKESCAYRQRESEGDIETIESDARIELTPGKSEIGVWKAAGESGSRQEAVGNAECGMRNAELSSSGALRNSEFRTPNSELNNAPDSVPLTQPDQGPQGDLIMPMFAQ